MITLSASLNVSRSISFDEGRKFSSSTEDKCFGGVSLQLRSRNWSKAHDLSVSSVNGSKFNSEDDESLRNLARDVAAATIEQEIASSKLLEKARSLAGRPMKRKENSNVDFVEISDALMEKLSSTQDLDEMISVLSSSLGQQSGTLSEIQCCQLIELSARSGNSILPNMLVNAMQASSYQVLTESTSGAQQILRWEFPPVSVAAYVSLVRGLTASLRVAEAIRALQQVRRRGLPEGDEVPFGKIIDCPTCQKPICVVQPHQGVQLVACSKCRYQYEVMSGDIVKCDSEALSGASSGLDQALRFLRLKKDPSPQAVHSLVVCSPDGTGRTLRFATGSPSVPAQPGERVSLACAAPLYASKRKALGLLSASTRVPGWRPGEPMALTNHITGEVSPLLRAPPPSEVQSGGSWPTWLLPSVLLLASSDAASGLVDPSLPLILALSGGSLGAITVAANSLVLPKINQLPERTAESLSGRQELLKQHSKLQARLDDLTVAAAQEVRLLARMWQLQNKMEAVGEPSTYSARMERVREVRGGLDERLEAKLELIDSYSKVAAMIEIEVEMSSDLLAAEAATAVESIADQIVKLEEVEELQQEWRLQAEANDEVERLLRSVPPLQE